MSMLYSNGDGRVKIEFSRNFRLNLELVLVKVQFDMGTNLNKQF